MKIIKIRKCAECFYVRNLADEENVYCCIRKIMIPEEELADFRIKNLKKIPVWCPLESG